MSDPNRAAEKARLRQEREQQYTDTVKEYGEHGIEFVAFPKIPRLNRNITITEKIDGTNAAIHITGRFSDARGVHAYFGTKEELDEIGRVVPQSRTRLLTRDEDNFGFAAWVEQNAEALRQVLGPGIHYGEWWGRGIQRGYRQERRWFSLFNYNRWSNDPMVGTLATIGVQVVPVLYHGPWMAVVGGPDVADTYPVRNADGTVTPGILRYAPDLALEQLAKRGSVAAMVSGITYRKENNDKGAEGIVVFHEAGRLLFKATLENDEQPKTFAEQAHEKWLDDIAKEPL